MKKTLFLIIKYFLYVLFLNLASCDGCEDCEKYTRVGTVLNEMLSRPEYFITYMDEHENWFNDRFYDCLDKKRNDIYDDMIDQLNYCDETFADPDFKFQCQEDHGVSTMENQIAFLDILKYITENRDQAQYYLNQFAYLKQVYESDREENYYLYGVEQPSWEELMESIRADSEEAFKCKYCKDSFLGIEY